jgi:hypothetical protein
VFNLTFSEPASTGWKEPAPRLPVPEEWFKMIENGFAVLVQTADNVRYVKFRKGSETVGSWTVRARSSSFVPIHCAAQGAG